MVQHIRGSSQSAVRVAMACLASAALWGAPAPAQAEEPEAVTSASGVELMRLPGGSFMMGPDGQQREVVVDAFYIGVYPVTQALYERVMDFNPSRWHDPRNPVEQVRWTDAAIFCNKLSEVEGLEPVYDPETYEANWQANGYRLPTEAEWEYAARAGREGAYFFGDNPRLLRNYAWFADNAGARTRPVGMRRPNPWGLHDMLGNVWEWCQDYYDPDYHETAPRENPRGPASGEQRVLRGGAWETRAEQATVTEQLAEFPGYADVCVGFDRYGFRIVRNVD